MRAIFGLVATLGVTLAVGGEIRYGQGSYTLEGGMMGMKGSFSTDVSAYTLAEQHRNLLQKTLYYAYNITWYDSDRLTQAQQTLTSATATGGGLLPGAAPSAGTTIPALEYKYQGLDLQGSLGYDLWHEGEADFLGVALTLGASIPWIDTQKSASSSNDPDFSGIYERSKTSIETYRVGPSLQVRKSLGALFSIYATGTYAYQTGRIKNDYARADVSVDGWYGAFDGGIRFQALSYDKEVWGISLSPRLYFTLGYHYSRWEFGDVAIDLSGTGLALSPTDMSMETSYGYVSIGYDLF